MKWIRKFKIVLLTMFVMSFLAGCSAGSTIETALNVNEDLSGSRVMDVVIADDVASEHFHATMEELSALIGERCPAELGWSYDESTGSKIYTFTLDFTSPEDYTTKVCNVTGLESEDLLTIKKADSVWASGVYVDESFSSAELLQWLKDAVVEVGYVSSSDSSKIFTNGSSIVRFGGEEYSAGSNIYVDEIEYLDIDSIELFTEASKYDDYNKEIVLTIPDDSMNLKGEEIKAWVAERVPSGAEAVWTEGEGISVYTVSKEHMTAADMQVFLNSYFDSDACVVTQTDIKEDMSPFSFNIGLVENVDFSNYIIGDSLYETDVNYYVKGAEGYVGGRYLEDLAYEAVDSDVLEENNGYREGNSEYGDGLLRTFDAYFQKTYRVSQLDVASSVGLLGGLKRVSTFTLEAEPTEEEREIILANIQALGVAYDLEKAAEEEALEETAEDGAEDELYENTMTDEALAEGEAFEEAPEEEVVTEEDAEAVETEAAEEEVAETEASEEEEAEEPSWKVTVKEKTKDGVYTITITQKGDRADIQASSEALFGVAGDMFRAKSFNFAKLKYDVAVYDSFYLGNFVDYTTSDMQSGYTLNTGFLSSITDTDYPDRAEVKGSKVTISEGIENGVSMVAYGSQFNLWALFFYLLIIIAIVCAILVAMKMGAFDKLKANMANKTKAENAANTGYPENTGAAGYGTYPENPANMPSQNVANENVANENVTNENARFCENCGAKRDADALVCTQCGTRFED